MDSAKSAAGGSVTFPVLPERSAQSTPQSQPASAIGGDALRTLAIDSSASSFSFSGSDAYNLLGVEDDYDDESESPRPMGAPQDMSNSPGPTGEQRQAYAVPHPPLPQQQQQQQQQQYAVSSPVTGYAPDASNHSSHTSSFYHTTGTSFTNAAPAATPHAVALSAANLEYFYGIPTPSAPARSNYETSTASNCSSSHPQQGPMPQQQPQQQQQSIGVVQHLGYHSSPSVDSNHTGSSYAPQAGDAAMAVPGGGSASAANALANAYGMANNNNNNNNSGGGGGGANAGVQKDVLAFMAAEQQQKKFVLQQRNVYMSGLPVDFRPSAFRAMCEVFGRIESSKLCMEANDANRCRGFGFVLFYDVESANSCISSLNGKVMQGKTLQVRRADLSAAPQPLNPVTQRNRTGSGLLTPPSLSQLPYGNAAQCPAYPQMFTPHPPQATSGSNNNNGAGNGNSGIGSSVMVSTLPFTFATPTMMAGVPVTGAGANAMLAHKASGTNSSILYGGPSASSSAAASSTPAVMYATNGAMLPGVRNGMPVMQMMGPQPLMSHPSLSQSDQMSRHTATPPSVASSNTNAGFGPSAPMGQQQQQQFLPQPPMQPSMQGQRPIASGANVNFYSTMDGQGGAVGQTMIAGNPQSVSGATTMMPNSGLQSMYAPSMVMQEYYAATALDPNPSSSNIYYLLPQ